MAALLIIPVIAIPYTLLKRIQKKENKRIEEYKKKKELQEKLKQEAQDNQDRQQFYAPSDQYFPVNNQDANNVADMPRKDTYIYQPAYDHQYNQQNQEYQYNPYAKEQNYMQGDQYGQQQSNYNNQYASDEFKAQQSITYPTIQN